MISHPLNLKMRFHLVRTCFEQLELAFKGRSWKLGPIPPDAHKMMRVGGHSTLVSFTSVLIGSAAGCSYEDLCQLPLLGELHDADEVYLGDVSWPQHKFSLRKKLEARAEIFRGTPGLNIVVPLLNRLDEKSDDASISLLVKCHEDGHQVASLLEIMAYISAGLAPRDAFVHSIRTLRSKLFTDIGRQLFDDISRVERLPVRSGVKWEEKLWEDLGLPLPYAA